jgi:hypothetical protein
MGLSYVPFGLKVQRASFLSWLPQYYSFENLKAEA